MGNTDSHSSVATPPTKSCSPRFSSRRETVPSARNWWRNSRGVSRGRGRGQRAAAPCTSWHHEHSASEDRAVSPLGCGGLFGGGGGCEQTSWRTPLEGGGSPKVLLSKDGSMRVEFSNARVGQVEAPAAAPVNATAPPPIDASLRTSNGSSLSSEGSWYDSPWGNGDELCHSVFTRYTTCPSPHAEETATGSGFKPPLLLPTTQTNAAMRSTHSSGRTEDSGIGDSVILQAELRGFSLLSPSAASLDDVYTLPASPPSLQPQRSTSALLDDVMQEDAGAGAEQCYSSHTLPCRRSEPSGSASNRKDFLKSRIQRLSDWTGSLSHKKRRVQEPSGDEVWSFNPLHLQNQNPNADAQCQNVYENFMQELETSCSRTELSEEEEEEEEEVEEVEQEEEHGAVRRAGWLCFKALISVSRDRKLQLVTRRRWRHYWVTLKGCSLLFYDTYGRSGAAERSPRYTLLADDAIVQAVPEHPKREHVFCLSNAYGDVYLLQATNQTDLENWVTAIHSASASLLARRQGTDDTLRLLRGQTRSLLHNIDMDGKMKKMAELQLSVIKEPKSRKAVESQIQQWEQNLEKLNLDLFRLRCYLSSLQGGELPNPKSLLAVASRPSKNLLGRLGVFSVSSFHALVCSRDEAALRRRRRLLGAHIRRRGLLSSLTAVDIRCTDQISEPPAPLDVFTLRVSRRNTSSDFGFAVTGHVDARGRSHVFISEVGPEHGQGLRSGDEVLAVNGAVVSGLDLDLMDSVFSRHQLQLLLRRDRSHDTPDHTHSGEPDQPPPPPPPPLSHPVWTTGSWGGVLPPADGSSAEQTVDQMFSFSQTISGCRATTDAPINPYTRGEGLQPTSAAHLSVCQRLCKVIKELVDTEKSYVKDLVCLFDIYLTPLQSETFLSEDEMEALFGSLPQMLDFQRVFLQTLEDRITLCPDVGSLETPQQFKKLLLSLAASFLDYADHFKLYSGFCANHLKVQKVLERAKTDGAFKHFLERRNPTNQHSSTLESFLIKPVQRVLKYPLLLRELVTLTEPQSTEHTHLTEALRAMEKVASHINEMQKIYEEFGCVFEQLAAEQSNGQVTEISMGEFLLQSSAVWLNPLPCLRRLRKEPELTLFVFRQVVILLYRGSSRLRRKMTSARSADQDPIRFRWLIPMSEAQVRATGGTGSDGSCVWELIHCRSEVEGRPETVFQLCSSGSESSAGVLRVLRCLLRDRTPSGALSRSTEGARAWGRSMGEGVAWGRSRQRWRSDAHRTCDRRRVSSCGSTVEETCSEPLLPSYAPAAGGVRSRLCSLTSDLEAQLQSLNFSEEAERWAETVGGDSRRQSSGELLDLSSILERDFSAPSVTSMVNEECFYDSLQANANGLTPAGH